LNADTSQAHHQALGSASFSSGQPVVVCYYRKLSRYALNVLAGALETDPHTAKVPIVFSKSLESMIDNLGAILEADARALVLWSFYSPQSEEIRNALQKVQSAVRDTRITHLAGGVHATAEPEHTLDMGFDYVAMGEGEWVIQEIVRRLQNRAPLHRIRGLVAKGAARPIVKNRATPVVLDDYACGSRYHLKYGPIEITRGCIYACRFCQTPYINKARFRHRSVEKVVSEVSWLKAAGRRDIRFISPSALSYGATGEEVDLQQVENLLASIRQIIGNQGRIFFGTFPSEVRPEHISERSLKILRKYVDNDNLVIGGQSGVQRVLDLMRRGHTVRDISRAVELCLACGFRPNVDFLFGTPGETPADIAQSVNFARELAGLGARIHIHSFMPLPGTPYRNQAGMPLPEPIRQALGNLIARGEAYGQWHTQQKIADELQKHFGD